MENRTTAGLQLHGVCSQGKRISRASFCCQYTGLWCRRRWQIRLYRCVLSLIFTSNSFLDCSDTPATLDSAGPFLGAIDHVKSLGGGTIIIPSGKYLLKQRIVLDGDNIVLRGEGPGSTILYYDEPLSKIDDRGETYSYPFALI